MLRADEFSFSYPTMSDPALSDVSFELAAGEVLGVVGPVEARKTTLAMALAGFAPRHTGGTTGGDLSVAGRDPRDATDNAVAMVFEDYSAQLTQVRVVDEVIAPLVNRGVPREAATDRADRRAASPAGKGRGHYRSRRGLRLRGGRHGHRPRRQSGRHAGAGPRGVRPGQLGVAVVPSPAPPLAARLARRVGLDALTADEFVESFAPLREASR